MPQFLEHSMTSWRGQQLSHQPSLIDHFDPRARIITMTLFALATAFSHNLLFPALALSLAIAVAMSANLHLQRTLRRVIAVDSFVLIMVIMLPFTLPGTTLFTLWGFPASEEGLIKAIEIALKTNAIILMLLALIGTMEATTLGHALARLHLPEKLVHLLLFTVRYLAVIGQEYKRMRKAMKARAFRLTTSLHCWRSIGYLVGMLLIRSLERSERTHAAMKCRGFTGKLYLLDQLQWETRDTWLVGLGLGLCALALLIGMYP